MAETEDSLGDRIKAYEARETERRALRGLPLIARVDGRSFSQFTRGMARPFDQDMADLMVEVTKYLVEETHAKVGYTQSDEISLIIAPWAAQHLNSVSPDTQCLFDGRLHKLTSVIAAMATARFLHGALSLWPERCAKALPAFDARVFEVPSPVEAVNAILWREMDATKNAISMAARAHFSHAALQNKSGPEMQEMLFRERGVNFNDYPARFKRGIYVQRRTMLKQLSPEVLARIPEAHRPVGPVERHEVVAFTLPQLRKIQNRVEVLFQGAEPVLASEAVDA